MNFRNIFKIPFQKEKSNNGNITFSNVKMLNSYTPFIAPDHHDIYDNLLIRACIDTIAKHCAKLTATVKGANSKNKNEIAYLLKYRPNRFMSAYDFIYKIVSMLFTDNNVFIYIEYNDFTGNVCGFYPIPYSQVEFLEYKENLYCKFFFKSGQSPIILPYSELIHLRRHFNQDDMAGSNQNELLSPTLSLFKSIIEGFINSIRATSRLRGYLKYVGNINPKDLKEYKDTFVSNYMNISTADGIGALDSKADFKEIKIEPNTIEAENYELANKQIYQYFGTSEEILTGKYTEEQYNAFYNSTIEPIAIQLSEEFTNKLFEPNEILRGQEVIFNSLRLTFANNSTKASICKEMLQLGIFTFNECREIFELERVDGGDKRIVSLNYVDADKANEYQGIEDNQKEDDKDDEKK